MFLALFCAAVAWPVMPFERRLPYMPDQAKLDKETGSWFHLKKDLWTETLRADCQWWGKLLAHMIVRSWIIIAILVLALTFK